MFSGGDLLKVSKLELVDEWVVGDEEMSKIFLAPSVGDGGAVRMSNGVAKTRRLDRS
jgi:hypothetical protein